MADDDFPDDWLDGEEPAADAAEEAAWGAGACDEAEEAWDEGGVAGTSDRAGADDACEEAKATYAYEEDPEEFADPLGRSVDAEPGEYKADAPEGRAATAASAEAGDDDDDAELAALEQAACARWAQEHQETAVLTPAPPSGPPPMQVLATKGAYGAKGLKGAKSGTDTKGNKAAGKGAKGDKGCGKGLNGRGWGGARVVPATAKGAAKGWTGAAGKGLGPTAFGKGSAPVASGKGLVLASSGKDAVLRPGGDGSAVTKRVVLLNKRQYGIDATAHSALLAMGLRAATDLLNTVEEQRDNIRNPSAFILSAARKPVKGMGGKDAGGKPAKGRAKGNGAAQRHWDTSAAAAAAGSWPQWSEGRGVKRPGEAGLAEPLAKRPTPAAASAASAMAAGAPPGPTRAAAAPAAGAAPAKAAPVKVRIAQAVATKVKQLKEQGASLTMPAVQALAAAAPRDALKVLQELSNLGKHQVDKPSQWVLDALRAGAASAEEEEEEEEDAAVGSLEAAGRVEKPAKAPMAQAPVAVAKAPVAKSPVTKAPVAKAPLGKAPVMKAKAPVAKLPAGKAPVAKLPAGKAPVVKAKAKVPVAKVRPMLPKVPGTSAPGAGQPPVQREGLAFEQQAVQAKVVALNSMNIWKGDHPVDEAALVALLRIDAARALELLDEAEEIGAGIEDISLHLRKTAAAELSRIKFQELEADAQAEDQEVAEEEIPLY